MTLSEFEPMASQAVDVELEKYVESTFAANRSDLKGIFLYHLSLEKNGKTEKQVKQLLTALCTARAEADWKNGLPAAGKVELIHNFSLIHGSMMILKPTEILDAANWLYEKNGALQKHQFRQRDVLIRI